MVEGHSVHRVASLHRKRLLGKRFSAVSPNGRFTAGAAAINGRLFSRIEAVGKNLFAFFGQETDKDDIVVVHVHFGMAGVWAVYQGDAVEDAPEPSTTNRLRLQADGLLADLSAMTVQHGTMDLYHEKRAKLGEDPLRDDSQPEALWLRVSRSKKSIGALIMDQSFFTGPGNIYRAEILFKAGVHPDVPGNQLEKAQFDTVWFHTVELLRRGYETGSILTVDPEEARALNLPKLRRYIYNTAKCPRCNTSIRTWTIASRTCYACPTCQPRNNPSTIDEKQAPVAVTPEKQQSVCVPFHSHCARESAQDRLRISGPSRLTVAEIKTELCKRQVPLPTKANKAALVDLLSIVIEQHFLSPEDAAAEKASAGESLAVEHIAELAPQQARKARSQVNIKAESKRVLSMPTTPVTPRKRNKKT